MNIIIKLNLQNTSVYPNIQPWQRNFSDCSLKKGMIMTSFVHTEYALQHPGVVRAERAIETFKYVAKGLSGSRATATLLLSAVVSALLVAANQVVDTWSDGHLLAGWIALWTVAFAGLALLAGPIRMAVASTKTGFDNWMLAQKRAEQDRKLWEHALTDARVMADISRAMTVDASRDVRGMY